MYNLNLKYIVMLYADLSQTVINSSASGMRYCYVDSNSSQKQNLQNIDFVKQGNNLKIQI